MLDQELQIEDQPVIPSYVIHIDNDEVCLSLYSI